MMDRDEPGAHNVAVYDIQLGCEPPETLKSPACCGRPRTTATQTALLGTVREPAQLDGLLEKLFSVGLVLDDVHRVTEADGPGDGEAIYEVRVEGELGVSLLSYLKWRHYIVPEQTLVRIAAGSADLLRYLRACTEAGASIERIRRVPTQPAGCG